VASSSRSTGLCSNLPNVISCFVSETTSSLGRGHRIRDKARMEELIEAERDSGIDDRPKQHKRKWKSKCKATGVDSEQDDNNFIESSSQDDTSDGNNSDCVEITNKEVGFPYFTCDYKNLYVVSWLTVSHRKPFLLGLGDCHQKQKVNDQ